MRSRYKKWAAPYLDSHPEYVLKEISKDDEFFKCNQLYLEIGIGKGEFINQISLKFPGHYLGIERDISILGLATKKVVEGERNDIKVICNDFDILYDSLTNFKFDKIFLNFPDPWPKKRHHKRRMVQRPRTNLMAQKLAPGGYLYFVTDWLEYAEFALEELNLTDGLKNKYDGFAEAQKWRSQTKFERKGMAADRPITEIFFEKQ